ncbi:GNAT family N-acetyltransferase [Ruegeria atlantica]|uniref:Putative acetyltransferase n=1 Tax=Ruegeria atlantica TaxID=81569 RepID=A0A0P1ESN2_9RHOB|nr:GNAT family N-acetyltransferase [Ruegeria atlantica]CUH45062.1 putative acetyltransferase [Ruegeria atlantica]
MSPNWADVVDGTWPAARFETIGPFRLRQGLGGGSRVSAASSLATATDADIIAAEGAMRAMGQRPIFCLRPGDERLDKQLADRGYDILDPVNIYQCPVEDLTDTPIPRVTAFTIWSPLAIMNEIWTQGGIGPERLAIMDRAEGPKTGIFLRHSDHPAGTGFVAIHDDVAMVHALEILPAYRRQGLGKWAMRAAAIWALKNGAKTLSVICTKANDGANGLYHALGMEITGEYHYRQLVQGE